MKTPSDDSLRQVRQILLGRGAELRDRLERVQRDLKREREPLPRDSADAAIAVENDEVLQAIENTAQGELERISLALRRLEDGRYTLCESCGAGIDAHRLQAIPYASQCARCAREV
jgi:RNA polymerase-binding transcription factor DksA